MSSKVPRRIAGVLFIEALDHLKFEAVRRLAVGRRCISALRWIAVQRWSRRSLEGGRTRTEKPFSRVPRSLNGLAGAEIDSGVQPTRPVRLRRFESTR